MKPESSIACSGNETQESTTRPLRHAQRKPNVNFKCSNCQRRFPSVLRLRRHLNLVHKGAGKLLWCSKCSFAFNEVSAFVQHSRIHHREKTNEAAGSSEVAHNNLANLHTTSRDFGDLEPKNDPKCGNKVTDGPNALDLGNSNAGCLPEVKDDSTSGLTSTELNALNDSTNSLSDVVTHEAINVTVAQLDAGHIPSEIEGADAISTKENPTVNHRCQSGSMNFKKNQQSSIGLEHECSSFLQGHPTMANIGVTRPSLLSAAGASKFPRSTVPNVPKGGSKIVKQVREPVFAVGTPHQTQFQSQSGEVDCAVGSMGDNLSISIPSGIQTINLMADTRGNIFQEKRERSEILLYLRSVTAKLDAIIRHFNVPFSEVGSTVLTPPFRNLEMQNSRSTTDMELEGHCDTSSFNLTPQFPRKRSSSGDLDCDEGSSPVIQRSVDTLKPSSNSGTQHESSLSFNGTTTAITRFVDEVKFNSDDVVLQEDLIRDLHSKSLNRGNFAKHLVFHLFSPEERKGKNCFGRRAGLQSGPKAPLDPIRLQYVRDKVFQYYPCEPGLEETIWRRQCVIAVDTALRGENRPHKKLM